MVWGYLTDGWLEAERDQGSRGLTTMQSWPISCSGVPRRDSLLLAAEFRGVTGAHRQGGGRMHKQNHWNEGKLADDGGARS